MRCDKERIFITMKKILKDVTYRIIKFYSMIHCKRGKFLEVREILQEEEDLVNFQET
jgi:hypothetical protein